MKKELTFKKAAKNFGSATKDIAVVSKNNVVEGYNKAEKVTKDVVIPKAKEGATKSKDFVEKGCSFIYPKIKLVFVKIWEFLSWLFSSANSFFGKAKSSVKKVAAKKATAKKTTKKLTKKTASKKKAVGIPRKKTTPTKK